MNKYFEKILSIPKSFYACIKLLPLREAIKMPIMVHYNCKLLSLKGKINIQQTGGGSSAVLRIGFGEVGIIDKKYGRTIIELLGEIVIKGRVNINHGSRLYIAKNAKLTFGKNFTNSAAMTICCEKEIIFGANVVVSWNTTLIDTDFHQTYNILTGERSNKFGSIIIGDNVWIGLGASILKNSIIPSGCIIGANALVNKKYSEENCLIAGNPACIKKSNISRAINDGLLSAN